MKAPFPWFGGKSTVSDVVWERFGNVPNYVEPFFGSGAVLLESSMAVLKLRRSMTSIAWWRTSGGHCSTTQKAVAEAADNPVNEADQHARHLWLCSRKTFGSE